MSHDPILEVIYLAIDDVNPTMPPDQQVPKQTAAPLAEPEGPLTSLGLVNLVVSLEDKITEAFGVSVNLADAQPATAAENPFATVQSLATHIRAQLPSSV